MVMALDPVIKGIVALHELVPDAVPDAPKLVDQVTDRTPALLLALPETVRDTEEVDRVVVEGDVMVSEGGAPAGDGFGDGLGVGAGGGGAGAGGAGAGGAVRAAYSVCTIAISSAESPVTMW
jgi:hypothetical protein